MHIPDGFLDARTAVATGVLATAGLGLALAGVRRTVPPRRIPLIGLAAAFVFAAQMLNFPVAGGTSGHLIGAVLAAVLLGPSAAVLVMSAVLILQCLMFADGGVTALGANLFSMALVAPAVGYGISVSCGGSWGRSCEAVSSPRLSPPGVPRSRLRSPVPGNSRCRAPSRCGSRCRRWVVSTC